MKREKQVPFIVKSFPGTCTPKESYALLSELTFFLNESYQPQVILDISNSPLTGASDIDLLLRCIEQTAEKDGHTILASPTPQARLILELTRIDRVATICDSLEEAKRYARLAPPALVEDVADEAVEEGKTRWAA